MPIDVSIIICSRNRARSLSGTLESLAAVRSQHKWEVLFVDNGSTDDTAEVVAAADDCGGRLRYLYEPTIGLGKARDYAWRQAAGRLLSFTDDDCYLDPGFVDAMVAVFAEHPQAGCAGGRILLFDRTDAPITIDERTDPVRIPPRSFVYPGMLQGANIAFRREALEASGGFDPALGAGTPYPCEDIDALAAVLWSGYEAWFDPRPLIYHHHRRKAADLPNVLAGYERGRGAFYAKYIGRRETRRVFLQKWISSPRHNPYLTLRSLREEIRSSLQYARRFQGVAAFFRLGIAALGMFTVWICCRAMRAMRSVPVHPPR